MASGSNAGICNANGTMTIDDVRVYNRALRAAEVWRLSRGQ
jgi:hypothetical protein